MRSAIMTSSPIVSTATHAPAVNFVIPAVMNTIAERKLA